MLPRPSQLATKGTPSEQIKYIIRYLEGLVRELEKSINTKKNDVPVAVNDIKYSDSKLIVTFTDGATKYINIGE